MEPNTPEHKHRVSPRKRVALLGNLLDEDRRFRVSCVIHDASQEGFRVYCLKDCHLPDFVLLEHRRLKVPIRAEVRWRDGKWAGLRICWKNPLLPQPVGKSDASAVKRPPSATKPRSAGG